MSRVPRFEPYTETTVLPTPGAIETNTLDFKGRLSLRGRDDPSIDHGEIAKDVAAFANLIGGVVLVGLYEDQKRGVLGTIKPLTDVEAKETREACSRAVRDLCWPKPVSNTVTIAYGTGVVVALNVWPFPGQAVGVRDETNQDAYSFPLRTGIDCTYLAPEQLPMLMLPELRRVVTLLYAIPLDASLTFQSFNPAGASNGRQSYTFLGLDELRNTASFSAGGAPFSVPLDMIKSVWQDAKGSWNVSAEARY